MHLRRTKIICTLGPSSDSVTEITRLVQAGMDIARLNFSHGTYENHLQIIRNLREVEKLADKKIDILQDLQGPKIRIGLLKNNIPVKRGDHITFTVKPPHSIPVQYRGLTKDVKVGHPILIDDGTIELKAEKVTPAKIVCKVIVGGTIKSHKGLNLPNSKITATTITAKDKRDLAFGLKHGIDFVALSFVKDARDMQNLRKLLGRHQIRTIAKIERTEAIENLEEIIKASNGVMVARGDLGVEMPPEQVPIIQKRIIALANKYGKFVITATQMLASMVDNPFATRAEISDAANAIFDRTSALMLSNETSVGKYPFKAAATLRKVAMTIEQEIDKHPELKFMRDENNWN